LARKSPWSPHKDAKKNDRSTAADAHPDDALAWSDVTGSGWYEPVKSALAVIGLVAVGLQLVKLVR
jgi:hypothetical protein